MFNFINLYIKYFIYVNLIYITISNDKCGINFNEAWYAIYMHADSFITFVVYLREFRNSYDFARFQDENGNISMI